MKILPSDTITAASSFALFLIFSRSFFFIYFCLLQPLKLSLTHLSYFNEHKRLSKLTKPFIILTSSPSTQTSIVFLIFVSSFVFFSFRFLFLNTATWSWHLIRLNYVFLRNIRRWEVVCFDKMIITRASFSKYGELCLMGLQ